MDVTTTNTPTSENEFLDAKTNKINNNYSKKNRYVNVCALEHSRIRIRRRDSANNESDCTNSNRNSAESNGPTIHTSTTSVRSNDDEHNDDDDGYINANYVDVRFFN